MHVKYAVLHCSYSAPVRVSDTAELVSVAARAVTVFFGVVVFVRAVVGTGILRGPDTVVRGAVVCVVADRDVVDRGNKGPVADVVVSRGETAVVADLAEFAVGLSATVVVLVPRVFVPEDVRPVVAATVGALVARATVVLSRTAASALPMQMNAINKRCKTFLISYKLMLANL